MGETYAITNYPEVLNTMYGKGNTSKCIGILMFPLGNHVYPHIYFVYPYFLAKTINAIMLVIVPKLEDAVQG